jgi:hypothetical protein
MNRADIEFFKDVARGDTTKDAVLNFKQKMKGDAMYAWEKEDPRINE